MLFMVPGGISTLDSAEKAAPSVGGYNTMAKSLGFLAVDAHAGRVVPGFSAVSTWGAPATVTVPSFVA
jgi:hypothetical protein